MHCPQVAVVLVKPSDTSPKSVFVYLSDLERARTEDVHGSFLVVNGSLEETMTRPVA